MPIGAVGQRIHRDEGAHQPELDTAFEFLARLVHVIHVQHGNALEPVRVRLAEIRDPVVVGTADVREQGTVGNAIPEEPLARLQAGPQTPSISNSSIMAWGS